MEKKPTYEELVARIAVLEKRCSQLQTRKTGFQEADTAPAVEPVQSFEKTVPRKQAQHISAQSEEKFRTVFESLTDVYFETTLDGRIINTSPSGSEYSGYSLEELIGSRVDKLYNNPDDREGLLKALSAHKKVRGYEMLFRRKDGTTYHVSINADLTFDEHGQPAGMKGTIRDISDDKRTREMMIQTEKMRSVHGLAIGLAHEINNPLAGILQNAQVMKNRITVGLPKNQQVAEVCHTTIEGVEAYVTERGVLSMIESILDSGKRAARIVSNLLAFSRKDKSAYGYANPGNILENALELAESDYELKKSFDFRGAEIIREYDSDTVNVWCDPVRIQQVFFNIIKNGIQAMAGAGTENPGFIFRQIREGQMVRIEIENKGPGMAEAVRRRVFEPFFTTRPVGKGVGLGMTAAYYIINEEHNGDISVRSAPGENTVFIIRLPQGDRMTGATGQETAIDKQHDDAI